MTEQSLAGKVAIVTGAASPIGMGHSMAAATVEAGGRVAIFDINQRWLEESAADIRSIGGDDCVLPVVADVTDPNAIADGVSTVIKELGGLHILMNNAGVWKSDSFREVSIESWNRIRAINLDGPFYMTKAVVEHMVEQGFGRIIGVTTSLASMWTPSNATYGGSKAGHEALASVIAKELEGTGVTSNVLIPGGNTYTQMTEAHLEGRKKEDLIPADIMKAPYRWLASDASCDFTGRRIVAYHWDESLPLESRLEQASAPAAWPQLGGFPRPRR